MPSAVVTLTITASRLTARPTPSVTLFFGSMGKDVGYALMSAMRSIWAAMVLSRSLSVRTIACATTLVPPRWGSPVHGLQPGGDSIHTCPDVPGSRCGRHRRRRGARQARAGAGRRLGQPGGFALRRGDPGGLRA